MVVRHRLSGSSACATSLDQEQKPCPLLWQVDSLPLWQLELGLLWWLSWYKKSTCNVGDLGSIPGLIRSPGERRGYPLQYSGLENSIDCYGPPGGKELGTTERLPCHFTSIPLDHQGSPQPSSTPSPAQPGGALHGRPPDLEVSRDHPLPAGGCYLLCGRP